ncbi:MAG TPA: hypothetical protein VD833_26565 [Vicinamibacterales bacterium]|nr:hypothetical protein [Vicinamibacterales bacterium]
MLKAFAWMRWRVLMNSLERTGARDVVERFSLAIEQIAPIAALLLLVPSGLALAGLGAAAGYALTRQGDALLFEFVRFLLLATLGFAIAGPLLLPAAGRPGAVRLLLLPIPRGTLYVAQAASAVTDPWILLALPMLLAIPGGLLAGGQPSAALVALAAGVLFVVVLLGISVLVALLLQLLFRDRRRGELAALLFILFIPVISMVPALLATGGGNASDRERDVERPPLPAWVRVATTAARYVPSELAATAIRAAARSETGLVAGTGLALAAFGLLCHGGALLVFGRLLDSPEATGGRRRAGSGAAAWRLLPGVTPAVSAIATTQMRLAVRTPRGRSILLSPVLVFVVLGFVMRRTTEEMDLGLFALDSGIGLATFGAAVCLLAIIPFAMNQFAIDGAGLTLVLLSPVRDEDYLAGKAIANGAIAGAPALFCVIAAYLLFPAGHPALWASIPLGIASTYLLVAPAAAALSALFPRPVNLNSIGRDSNAQGLAGLAGVLATIAAGVPALLIWLACARLLNRPALLPLCLAVWVVIAFGLSRLAFRAVSALLRRRRENLAVSVG